MAPKHISRVDLALNLEQAVVVGTPKLLLEVLFERKRLQRMSVVDRWRHYNELPYFTHLIDIRPRVWGQVAHRLEHLLQLIDRVEPCSVVGLREF